jgi:hypothetical protein
MNQQARRQYSERNQNQLKRFEAKYLRVIYRALRKQVDAFVADMEDRGIERAKASLYTSITTEGLAELLQGLHLESGLFWARKGYREINKSAKTKSWMPFLTLKKFGYTDEWINIILDFFAQDMLSMVSKITDTTRNQIQSVLQQALEEGQGIDWIARQLKSPEMLLWRARLIARTELVKGTFAGRKAAGETSEWETTTEWIAANDHRTRHSHRLIDGEMVDTGSRFQVTRPEGGVDMMLGPGDPTASIENLANCRCSSAMAAKRDANGKLIPKRKISVIMPGEFVRPGLTVTI